MFTRAASAEMNRQPRICEIGHGREIELARRRAREVT
jgi:hypothetical protein